jgi:hypothetical protein
MVVRWVPRLILLALLVLGTTTVLAQTHHTRSPYAGQFSPSAPIRALSPEEVRQIAAGEGAGLAKSAELNGGDLETVHLAAHLATAEVLSPDQIAHYNKMRGY